MTIMFSADLQQKVAEAGASRDYAADAREHHAKAEALTDAILSALHRGNNGATRPTEISRDALDRVDAQS